MTIEPLTQRESPGQAATGRIRPRLSRILKASALVAALLGAPGCGEEDVPPGTTKQEIKFDEVPENVRAAATKAIPNIPFKEAWKNVERGGKLHSYEIRGQNPANGKTREVRVSPTGDILEME
jgi:hypothetical protein